MEEINKNTETNEKEYICSSCGIIIKSEEQKHCFFEDDIEHGLPLECLDCHLGNYVVWENL